MIFLSLVLRKGWAANPGVRTGAPPPYTPLTFPTAICARHAQHWVGVQAEHRGSREAQVSFGAEGAGTHTGTFFHGRRHRCRAVSKERGAGPGDPSRRGRGVGW